MFGQLFAPTTPSLPSADDRHLARKVNSALGRLSREARTIHAEVLNGTVTLRGRVRDFDQKHLLQLCIRRIPGVHKIEDAVTLVIPDLPGAPEFETTGTIVPVTDSAAGFQPLRAA